MIAADRDQQMPLIRSVMNQIGVDQRTKRYAKIESSWRLRFRSFCFWTPNIFRRTLLGMKFVMPLILIFAAVYNISCSHLQETSSSASANRNPCGDTHFQAPPQPIIQIEGNTFYSDREGSEVDQKLYVQNDAARKPLRDYLDQILNMTDKAELGDVKASLAVEQWLSTWARADALTQVTSQQAGFERKWILSGLLIAYIRNKPYQAWQSNDEILRWLEKLTRSMMVDYQDFKKSSQRNNHAYWAGLVSYLMGTASGSSEFKAWGLERKSRALQYHRVAIEPMMLTAFLAKQDGLDLLKENNGALDRLAKTLLQAFEDPKIIQAKVDVGQKFDLKDSTVWLEIYNELKPGNSQVEILLQKYPPVWNRSLGGKIEGVVKPRSAGRCEAVFR
jgi:poly(beta-D-mannuronate) lyase